VVAGFRREVAENCALFVPDKLWVVGTGDYAQQGTTKLSTFMIVCWTSLRTLKENRRSEASIKRV